MTSRSGSAALLAEGLPVAAPLRPLALVLPVVVGPFRVAVARPSPEVVLTHGS